MSELEVQTDGRHITLRPTGLEKAVFSIIIAIVIGLLSWVGVSVMSTHMQVAVLNSKLDLIQKAIQADVTLRYASLNEKIEAHERRISRLEDDGRS